MAASGAGQFQEAEQAFLKAQSINPSLPPESHLKLADVYLGWKQYEKARAEMQAYLVAEPSGRFAGETRILMKRLESSGMLSSTQGKADAPHQ